MYNTKSPKYQSNAFALCVHRPYAFFSRLFQRLDPQDCLPRTAGPIRGRCTQVRNSKAVIIAVIGNRKFIQRNWGSINRIRFPDKQQNI